MFGLGFTFLLNSLCALNDNICIPLNAPPVPESSSSRSSRYLDLDLDNNSLGLGLGLGSPPPPPWWTHQLPIIETKYGLIEGYRMSTIRNRSILGFEGIRYARPPLGQLRFRPPVPIREKWDGIQQATKLGNVCLQMDATQYYRIYGHEDCLFINVYTPQLPPNTDAEEKRQRRRPLLPVLFFIHGGGHFFGTSGLYGPAYLLDTQNVLMVTFNYRVGVLGYLSTGDEASPGNYALKDQALALAWVQENIETFGGNPKDITLMGQSAGSVVVGLHLLSHKTRDIPVAAIMHSGDPLSLWGVVNGTFESTIALARRARCPTTNSQRLVQCLRGLNANHLVQKQFEIFKRLTFPIFTFGPVVEYPHPEAFLIESPEMAYARGNVSRVPILQGLVANEGDFLAGISYLLQYDRVINREFETILPLALEFANEKPSSVKSILRQIDAEYFPNNEPLTFWSRGHISRLFGDRFLNFGIRKGLEWHSKFAPTYGFFFNYKGHFTSLEALGLRASEWGVSHIDDLQYIFNCSLYFKSLSTADEDFRVVDFVTNVWGNFITKKKPYYTDPQSGQDLEFWAPVNSEERVPQLLLINQEKFSSSKMGPFPYETRYQFWRSFKLKDDFDLD